METVGVEPTPPRCKRGALPPELHPLDGAIDANGWSRIPLRAEVHTRLQRRKLSNAQRSQEEAAGGLEPDLEDYDLDCLTPMTNASPMPALPASATPGSTTRSNAEKSSWPAERAGFFGGGRSAGFEPEPRGSRPRVLPLHHDHHVSGDDRTRTGACSRDKRVLSAAELRPHSAGGIRTHGLELMRLAGTATPLRRDLPGWSRTSDLRRPKPAGWPISPTGSRDTPGGTRTRSFRIESPASFRFDHRGMQIKP